MPLQRMPNFREIYCEQHRCTPAQFSRKVFWACLYHHAKIVAPLLLLVNYDFFSADRTLISSAAEATNMKRIRDDVREFFWDSTNSGWLRRRLNIRMSGQRLKNLARRYLPEGESAIPFPPRENPESAGSIETP